MGILIGLLALIALIFVHELGHYLVARWVGVKVEEFAIGFGPKLLSRKYGETTWSIRACLIGGFVSFKDEYNSQSSTHLTTFNGATPFRRILIMLGGVAGNFVGAVILYALILLIGIRQDFFVSSEDAKAYRPFVSVSEEQVFVSSVTQNGSAYRANLHPGDEILMVNGQPIFYAQDVLAALSRKQEQAIIDVVDIVRKGDVSTVTLNQEEGNWEFTLSQSQLVTASPMTALPVSIAYTSRGLWRIVSLTPHILSSIIVTESLGPVVIVIQSAKANEEGLIPMLMTTWSFSLWVILLSLFPIPITDGGRILLTLPELLIKKKLSRRVELAILRLSVVGMLVLSIFFIINEILKLIL